MITITLAILKLVNLIFGFKISVLYFNYLIYGVYPLSFLILSILKLNKNIDLLAFVITIFTSIVIIKCDLTTINMIATDPNLTTWFMEILDIKETDIQIPNKDEKIVHLEKNNKNLSSEKSEEIINDKTSLIIKIAIGIILFLIFTKD